MTAHISVTKNIIKVSREELLCSVEGNRLLFGALCFSSCIHRGNLFAFIISVFFLRILQEIFFLRLGKNKTKYGTIISSFKLDTVIYIYYLAYIILNTRKIIP